MQCYSGFVKRLDHGNFTNLSSSYPSPQVIFIHDFDPSNLWRSWIRRIPIPTSTCKSFNQVTNSPTNVFKLWIFNVFGLFVVDDKSTLWWKLTLNHASILAYYIVSPPFVDCFLPSTYWIHDTRIHCVTHLGRVRAFSPGFSVALAVDPGLSGRHTHHDTTTSILQKCRPRVALAKHYRHPVFPRSKKARDRWKQSAFANSTSTPPAETPTCALCWM